MLYAAVAFIGKGLVNGRTVGRTHTRMIKCTIMQADHCLGFRCPDSIFSLC